MFGCFFMKRFIRVFDIFLAVICAVIMGFVVYGNYAMPDKIVSYENDTTKLSSVYSYSNENVAASASTQAYPTSNESVKFLNIIPVKNVKVTNKHSGKVFVSGEVFGIKLYTDGVVVVGTQSVDVGEGEKVNPAEESGILTGDIIVSINNVRVFSSTEVTSVLNDNNGKPYVIKIKRDGRYKTFTLTPAYSPREGCYKAGMWVRDSTAGIGTLTFYNEESGMFASLGHQINDVDTNEILPLLEGEAVSASVTKVQQGKTGTTGSLWCDFEENTIGKLIDNTNCGLYGAYTKISDCAREYAVSSKQEVRKGSAKLISTVKGKTPEQYDIEITKISYTRGEEQKDIIFKVNDKKLLKDTGGIVQGMSGSPIIQNNKLVGAVTHVIVNNPEKGYAIFAQTMYEKSNEYN